ncbi:cupin domain-containing protein [Bradyrhizobium sp. SSUT112]|uniref:cupin domain-containing protein n=1 Tax=Bradyrhizobium sp. SSUT112 TaxID=3040604 RepID=UPI00244A600B|nr:cupin domain-containing protein [Bradyrhizobium sp. SSUT112]MDH2351855.1 cupin domain-containing protein [Bradyrhizobium sp. SSUT112]
MPLAPFDTSHCNVDLNPSPIEPSWIIEGNPKARSRLLSTSGCKTAWTLIWSCTEGRFKWHYDFDETIMILEGSIVLETDGMPPKRYGVGDVVFFRSGASVTWYVEGYVKKVAFCRLTNALGLGYAIRALNKLRSVIARNKPALVPALACFNLLA